LGEYWFAHDLGAAGPTPALLRHVSAASPLTRS
jgi:hypothetical protein